MIGQRQQHGFRDAAIDGRGSTVPEGRSQREVRRHPVQRPAHIVEASRRFAERKRANRDRRGVVGGRVAHVTREVVR